MPLTARSLAWPSLPGPAFAPFRIERAARGAFTLLPAGAIVAIAIAAHFYSLPWMLWSALLPALWIAFVDPVRLIQLLLISTPILPVVRMAEDMVGARAVSTKGLFLSIDDPLIVALVLVWLIRALQRRKLGRFFPSALLWLMLVYPLVILLNLSRLSLNQSLISALYYLKWVEYAGLLFLIPGTFSAEEIRRMTRSLRKLVIVSIVAAAAFAAYEVAEAVRTGTYTSAAKYPRASSFFGTLDPARFGSSEDPVNFGCYAMVAGAILYGFGVRRSNRPGTFAGTAAAAMSVVLSGSRAPLLASAIAVSKISRIRSSRLLLAAGGVFILLVLSQLLVPEIWSVSAERVEALLEWNNAEERSAIDRLTVVWNSPVFELDQYWLSGHGFSSYRFVAEEHLAGITRGVSRSLYNFPMTAWYDAGLAGLLLWVMIFFQLDRRLTSIAGGSGAAEVHALAWGLRGALWGLATASLFGEVPYNWRVIGFFYCVCGICFAAARVPSARPLIYMPVSSEASR